MALIKFELKEDHIKLIKHLKWSMTQNNQILSRGNDNEEYGDSPFGGDDLFEDMDTILNGKAENFDPLNDEKIILNETQIAEMRDLFDELPIALDIILYTSKFEPGHYKSKWYDRNWIKTQTKPNLL
jgi:hypothetical protein